MYTYVYWSKKRILLGPLVLLFSSLSFSARYCSMHWEVSGEWRGVVFLLCEVSCCWERLTLTRWTNMKTVPFQKMTSSAMDRVRLGRWQPWHVPLTGWLLRWSVLGKIWSQLWRAQRDFCKQWDGECRAFGLKTTRVFFWGRVRTG